MKLIRLRSIKMIELLHLHLRHCRVPGRRGVEIEGVTLSRIRSRQIRIARRLILGMCPHPVGRRFLRKVACEGCLVKVRWTRHRLLIRRVPVGGRKTASRMNLLLGIVDLPRMGCVGKLLLLLLLLPLPVRCYVHRLEGIALVDGPVQALQRRQVLRRSMMRELCLGDWLLQVV